MNKKKIKFLGHSKENFQNQKPFTETRVLTKLFEDVIK